MRAKIVFMGSPEFALPSLQALADHYPIVGVVTQPDRPSGRGRILTPPPVKPFALDRNLPLIQPRRLRVPEAMAQLENWQPDLIVVAAFGQILKPEVLDLPPYGCVNVHASLLPRWRGAAPIQAALLNGDLQTGVTIMRMDPGIDTGPILSQQAISVHPDDTAETMGRRLANLGADLLLATLPDYLEGKLQLQSQNDSLATYAPMLKKEDGLLDFSQPAETLERKVRAFHPWPGAYTLVDGQILKIIASHAVTTNTQIQAGSRPGGRVIYLGLPAFLTSKGLLVLDRAQPAGKKSMTGEEFLRGARLWEQF
jgi:methionyl-tRNA formyltransferase